MGTGRRSRPFGARWIFRGYASFGGGYDFEDQILRGIISKPPIVWNVWVEWTLEKYVLLEIHSFCWSLGMFLLSRISPKVSRSWPTSKTDVVVSNIVYFHPYLGKWSNLTNIFQMGWNYQLGWICCKIGWDLGVDFERWDFAPLDETKLFF